MHDVLERHATAVRTLAVPRGQPGTVVRELRADGLQHRVRDELHDILLRRGVRAQAPRDAHVRLQLVLLQRLPVRDHVVRHHGRLEAVRAHDRGRADLEHGSTVPG